MRFIFALITMFCFWTSYGQTYPKKVRIPLKPASSSYENITSDTRVTLSTDTNLAKYKVVPGIFKEATVKTYAFDYTNLIYQMYKDKKLTDSLFKHLEKIYSFNKSDFSQKKVNSKVKILYAKDNNNIPFFIFDTNNDSSFINEKIYREQELKKVDKIKIRNVETVIEGKLVKESIFINIDFDCKEEFTDSLEQKWRLCAYIKHDKTATFSIPGFSAELIAANNIYYGFKFLGRGSNVFIRDAEDITNKKKTTAYKVGDTFYSEKYAVKIDTIDISGSYIDLTITANKDQKKFGVDEGTFVKPSAFRNNFDSTLIKLNDYLGRYIFIDFWGTWCVPCKAVNPEVLKLREEILNTKAKDSIIFINVAYENHTPIQQIREQMDKYYQGWNSVLEFQDTRFGVIKQLRISAFPTFLFISPAQQILARKEGSNEFSLFAERIKSLLSK